MMDFILGKTNKKEEKDDIPVSLETIRIQKQLIKEHNNSSFNLHLSISNSMTLNQMKTENLRKIFEFSKEIDASEKFKKPKPKFWLFNRTQSEVLGQDNEIPSSDDLSD